MTFKADGTLNATVSGPTWIHIENGATFGGGTIALKFLGDDGNLHAMQDSAGAVVAYAAGADDFYDFPNQANISLVLSGSTSPTIYAQIRTEPRR